MEFYINPPSPKLPPITAAVAVKKNITKVY